MSRYPSISKVLLTLVVVGVTAGPAMAAGSQVSSVPGPAAAALSADEAAALKAVDRVAGQGESGSKTQVPSRSGQGAGSLDKPQLAITPRLHGQGKSANSGTTALLSDSVTSLKVAVQPLRGGVRLLSVLKNAATPNTTTYDVRLPAGAVMQRDSLGGVVVREKGRTTSRFSAPWAKDAAGRSLPTHYTLKGNALTQVVDTRGAKFPVVADPQWFWDFLQTGYHFNKLETANLAVAAGAASAFAMFAPPPFNVLLLVEAVTVAAGAQLAVNAGSCILLTAAGTPIQYGGDQVGGYCR